MLLLLLLLLLLLVLILSPIYTIQPVVELVVKPVDYQLYHVYKHSIGCQSSRTTLFDNRLNEQWLFVQHGCQTRLTAGCIVYTNIQPVVKPVCQPVGCLFTRYSRLSNRLYRVNGVLVLLGGIGVLRT